MVSINDKFERLEARRIAKGGSRKTGRRKKKAIRLKAPIRLGKLRKKQPPRIIRALGSPKLTGLLAGILGGLAIPGVGGFIGRGLATGGRGLLGGIAKTVGLKPLSLGRLTLAGLIGSTAISSPIFRRGLLNIPSTIVSTGRKIGGQIEAGGIDVGGISPLGVLGAGLLGTGLGGLGGFLAGRRGGAQDINITVPDAPAQTFTPFPSQLPAQFGAPTQAFPSGSVPSTQLVEEPLGAVKVPKKPTARRRTTKKAPTFTNIIQNQIVVS